MEFPVWEPFVSNSILIAVVAIVHVFVSHFAIGGGLYLVLMETIARRRDDTAHLAYVQRHSRFFLLVTIVFGAVTGVGIWITIGLISPVATTWLIHTFVWGFATEWVFFLVEIAAIIIYYYGWKRLAPSTHLVIGWIYFVAAWMSLFVINGIVTFMLTPGQWLTTGNFWDGFFNPTFWPSLLFRTFICLMLAGLYATVTIAKEKDAGLKARMLRYNGVIILGSLILASPVGYWYFKALPSAVASGFISGATTMMALQVMVFAAGLLFLLTLLGTIIFPRNWGYVSAGVLLLCGLLTFGGFEWTRESLRKPFVIYDFLYGNNILKADAKMSPEVYPEPFAYTTGDRGRDLYLNRCRPCHTISGYQSLADKLAGVEQKHIENICPRLQFFTGKMPPFPGNEDDAGALAKYLISVAAPDPLAAHPEMPDTVKGRLVFARRCGGCHTLSGGFRPLGRFFAGQSAADAAEIIGGLTDITDQMPPFTGSDEELRLLILYLTGGDDAAHR